MNPMNTPPPQPKKNQPSFFKRNAIVFKSIAVIVLTLLLLIPMAMIRGIIKERERLRKEAITEVQGKWARSQTVSGPVLTIPYIVKEPSTDRYKRDTIVTKHILHILPEELNISGNIDPEQRKRGIYDIVVYKTKLKLEGYFTLPEVLEDPRIAEFQWEDARVTIGIPDLRGIHDTPQLQWGDSTLEAEAGTEGVSFIHSGISTGIPERNREDFGEKKAFSIHLNLKGSQMLRFIPVGKETNVKLSSGWKRPKFNGAYVTDANTVTDNGFTASWKVLHLNRNYPQHWTDEEYSHQVTDSNFGVDLLLPVDDYQKSTRSAKYAILTIALTFLVFFLVELLHGLKIHPIQYGLVGLALCLFYILLISISEHSNFNLAYLIASAAIIGMITLYSLSVFKKIKLSLVLTSVMIALYIFLFIILQLQDYALLMGSIGLFLILALTMFFTRRVKWYGNTEEPPTN